MNNPHITQLANFQKETRMPFLRQRRRVGVGLAARKAETHTTPGVGGEPDSPQPSGYGLSHFFFFNPFTNISRPGCISKSGNLKKTQALLAQVVESPCNAGDLGSIPGSGSSPGGGNGNPLQYSRLENPMDRGAMGLQRVGHN